MTQSNKPRLTFAAVRALVDGDMENFIVAATPGGIEAQEKRGQQTLVASETLPVKINWGTRQEFEAMGIVFDPTPVPPGELFVKATLPPGWKKVPTSHDMWSELLDEKGRKRAGIFYKAAFYDRDAFMSATPRYRVTDEPLNGTWEEVRREQNAPFCARVYRQDESQTETSVYQTAPYSREDYALSGQRRVLAEAWLTDNYPDWRNANAYWD